MAHLLLIRGLSGSGKSTPAKQYAEHGFHHLETDMWFTNTAGQYTFVPSKLGEYHAKCLAETKLLLAQGVDVVVSNTFSTYWEIEKYASLITSKDGLSILQCNNIFENTHNVPEAIISAMAKRWEDVITDGVNIHHRITPKRDFTTSSDHTSYRIYENGDIINEEEFEERDNGHPYYDDYSEYCIPDYLIEYIIGDSDIPF